MYDYEVPVQLAHLSYISQHVPATADAGRRDRHHQHAVCNKPMEHELLGLVCETCKNRSLNDSIELLLTCPPPCIGYDLHSEFYLLLFVRIIPYRT